MPADDSTLRVRRLLSAAAKHLETVDPNPVVGDVVAQSFDGDDASDPMASGEAITPHFAENAPGALSLLFRPGGVHASPRDRVETSILAARRVIDQHLGRDARKWLEGRVEPAVARDYRPERGGGTFGSSFDRFGVAESVVGFNLTGSLIDSLVPALHRLGRMAMSALPGLRPTFTMVRCGRTAGTQQITFDIEQPLALGDLKPLMHELGLGHQHGSMVSATAFLLGARFTLPPNTAQLTLRPVRGGVEMRLDVMLEAIDDPPPQMLSLLRLLMTERPRSLRTLDRWLSAFTPEGFPSAGDFTVLSVWARHDVPARVALYLRPAALATQPERAPSRTRPRHELHHPDEASPWDS
ncbi:hypothetical protein [Pendulispora albinea]|uniref:Uncharacterized protein n=1 Tax=Pendulispora albinea TaxID=2741071 RepID=A0ABZ2M153_9BACT